MSEKTSSLKLIPVMLAFFAMGFVDLVGIASNYLKADLVIRRRISSRRSCSSGS